MSEEEEHTIEKRLSSLVPLVKSLIGGAVVIAGAVISAGVWIYSQQEVNAEQESRLDKMEPRVSILETRAVRIDSQPPVTISQFHDLDKRLDRMEQAAGVLREQNSQILMELRKLQN